MRALRRWQAAAGIDEGALFRRIWQPPTRAKPGAGPRPSAWPAFVVGTEALNPHTVQKRTAAARHRCHDLGGHSLKRGALTTGINRGVHPTKLKRLGRHKSYNVLDEYLEAGDPFDGHPLDGVL